MIASAAFCLLTVAAGWATLWPLRARIGFAHHLAAVPFGMLVWTLVACAHAAVAMPWSALSFAVVAVVACALSALGLARLAGPSGAAEGAPPPAWTYAAAAVLAAAIGAGTSWLGRSFVTADSWANYEPMGMRLYETGGFFVRLFEERSPLVPAAQAAHRALGGDWLVALFPLAAVCVAATVAWGLYREAARRLPRLAAAAITAVTVGLMCTSAMFVLQTLYVHSHMVSAAGLVVAFAAIVAAAEDGSPAWFAVAGGAAAAFALARPDGLAYAVLPLVAALAFAHASPSPRRSAVAFLAALGAPVLLAYGVAVARLGWWHVPTKLSATKAFAVIGALLLLAALIDVAPRLVPRWRELLAGRSLLLLFVAMSWCATGALAYVKAERFAEAGRAMLGNLVSLGGHGPLWGAFVAAVVLAAAFPRLRRALPATSVLLFATLEFMSVAYVVHALTHLGHLGWSDSFNRIAFHSSPLVWWLLGSMAAAAIAELRTEE